MSAEPLTHGGLSAVSLGGELGRRREIQKKYLYRFQAGNLRNNEGFLDFEKDLIGYYTNRQPRDTIGDVVLCSYSAVGKTLDAAVQYAYSSGDADLIKQKDRWIDLLIQSQDENGYIGMVQPEDNDRWFFRGWVIHDGAYICIALMNNYEMFGHEPSLAAARRFLDLVMREWSHAPSAPGVCSPVGLPEAFWKLYQITGNADYFDFFAETPLDGRFIDMESVRDWKQYLYPMDDSIKPMIRHKVHTYRFFDRCLDQLDLFGAQSDDTLNVMTDYALGKMVDPQQPGLFISGATGRAEGWVNDQDGRGGVGEACAVVYQIWLLDRLIEQRGDLAYGDMMERMVLNHMCAAQSTIDGRSRYFTALSGVRSYHKGAHCCEGNTRRFWAGLPRQVFYTGSNTVAVNLYTPSELRTGMAGTALAVRQITDYPRSGTVTVKLDPQSPLAFNLDLRIPAWAKTHSVEINGAPAAGQPVRGGIRISRVWRRGDTVTLTLPMDWRWVNGHEFYAGRQALMRGPQLFCVSRDYNPQLAGTGLSAVTIDPASVRPAEASGLAAERNGQMATAAGRTPDGKSVEIVFTDFPEEHGEETYFPLTDASAAVEDELYRSVDLHRQLQMIDAQEKPALSATDDFSIGGSGETLDGKTLPGSALVWTVSGPGCEYTGDGGVTFSDGQSTAHGHVTSATDAAEIRMAIDFCPADPGAFATAGRITLGMGHGYNRGYWAENGRDTLTVCMGPLAGSIRLQAFDFESREKRTSSWATYAGFSPQTGMLQDYSMSLCYNRQADELNAALSNKVTGAVLVNRLNTSGMEFTLDSFGFELVGTQASPKKVHIDRFELKTKGGK